MSATVTVIDRSRGSRRAPSTAPARARTIPSIKAKLAQSAGTPRRAATPRASRTRAQGGVRGQDRRGLVLRRGIGGAAAPGRRRSIRTRRSCSSTPASCSARRCAIATGCRTCSASATSARSAPHPADRARADPDGTLWSRDTDACCNFRKVIPLRRALEGFAAQITGRKRFQTQASAPRCSAVEFFEGRFRFNPLADWTPGRSRSLHRAPQPAAPSAGRGRLSLHRLHALHAPRPRRRRLPRRPLVRPRQGRMRHPRRGRRGDLAH